MKKNKIFLALLSLPLLFTACESDSNKTTVLVDFEDVTLKNGIWNGSDNSGGFTTKNVIFKNKFDSAVYMDSKTYFWTGFAASSKVDTKTGGYDNQYSVMAGSGANNSAQFALAFDSASIEIPSAAYEIKSMMITNSTYAYLALVNGSAYSKKFGTNDWFKVIITGYMNNVKTGKVEYYLADFRDGKTFLSNTWNKVDVSGLGKVNRVSFKFDSSDKSGVWLNNPAYACIDNIIFEKEEN